MKEGDVIEAVDGKKIGQSDDGSASWNAETLPEYLGRAARDAREVQITLKRPAGGGQESENLEVRLAPRVPIQLQSPFPVRLPGTPMGSDEIGIAYRIESEIAGVQPEGPAASAALSAGDTILKAKIIYSKPNDGETPDPLEIELGSDKPYWPSVFDAMQFVPEGTLVELTVASGKDAEPRQIKLTPTPTESAFVAARGFWFKPLERTRQADSLAEQIRHGWDETAESLTMVFRFLKKLGTQVPLTALGGPVTIAKAAGYSAAEGLSSLLIFLTMLSANLAVINFLPIPLLDGGHMVFLAYEWVRGRPANERFVVALHTAGFVFIVTLMLYVLALDFNLIERNL
jgi:regulator of sigma E protease